MTHCAITKPCPLCGRTLGLLWNDALCQDCAEWEAWAIRTASWEAHGDEIGRQDDPRVEREEPVS